MSCFRTMLVVLFVVPSVVVADGPRKSEEAEILDQWLGTWKSLATVKPSGWTPTGSKHEDGQEVGWILDGHFQEVESREGRAIQRYDPKKRKYEKWTFDSEGNATYWTGAWSKKKKAMMWSFDVGFVRGTMMDQFLSEDSYLTIILIKDSGGERLLDIEVKHSRVNR